MKATIYNIITAVIGIACMVGYVVTAGANAELSVLALMWAAIAVISFAETILIVSLDQAEQNEKERQLVAQMKKNYKI